MTNVERAFIHQLAQTMGLKSKSDGKGEDRFLTVTKKGMTIISIHINLYVNVLYKGGFFLESTDAFVIPILCVKNH